MTTAQAVLQCPACEVPMDVDAPCPQCGLDPGREEGLIDFLSDGRQPVPEPAVNAFYEGRPFPGYAPGDDATSLLDRSRRSPFLVSLDEAIPADATVLDAGCGTGQVAAFLALSARRRNVFGVDACRASLDAANGFRTKANIENLQLIRGNLLSMPVAESRFDVVNCRGVVHHNADWAHATRRVARHVKPGGYLVLGFYESIARMPHRVRRQLLRMTKKPVRMLDPILRRRDLTEDKKVTWIEDQYFHPLEWCLPFPKVLDVVKGCGFQWIRSVPPAPGRASMFDSSPEPSAAGLFTRRVGWAVELGDEDAGLVCLVAKRDG